MKRWKNGRHQLASIFAILAGVTGRPATRGPQLTDALLKSRMSAA
jgi:hypothetical protein